MKYFLIGMDEENKTPYNINKNRAIDIRMLSKENLNKLPLWNVLETDMPQEGFFPDIICRPFLLLSGKCVKTAVMYQPDILFKGVKLWDKKSGINATYLLTILDSILRRGAEGITLKEICING